MKKYFISALLSTLFIFLFTIGCVNAETQIRNVVVYTTADTSGLIISINEHKGTFNGTTAKSTVTNKYLVFSGTQKIENKDSGRTAKVVITGQLGNTKQSKTSTIKF